MGLRQNNPLENSYSFPISLVDIGWKGVHSAPGRSCSWSVGRALRGGSWFQRDPVFGVFFCQEWAFVPTFCFTVGLLVDQEQRRGVCTQLT